jgi:signal transduction histidine kinase
MADVSIYVAVITGGAGVAGAAVVQGSNLLRQQRKEASEEIQGMAKSVLDSKRSQETQDTRQADLMMRATTEFSYSTERLAEVVDLVLKRLTVILDEPGNVTNISVGPSFDRAGVPRGKADMDGTQVIRELAHSLGTPLAQIKAESLRLSTISGGQQESFDKIAASVDLCNSFISSFREIARISGKSSIHSFASLNRAINIAAEVYMSGDGKHVLLEVDVPDAIDGYSNTYLLSILAPLVENAVEASPEGGVVEVSCLMREDSIVFRTTNRYMGTSPSSESFASGVSTKQGHEGMGLATVKRLVESRRNGSVDCAVDGDHTIFSINLPTRHK